jgi:hypothetical protein
VDGSVTLAAVLIGRVADEDQVLAAGSIGIEGTGVPDPLASRARGDGDDLTRLNQLAQGVVSL